MFEKLLSRFTPQKRIEPDPNNIPTHVAIIMDGNGRWARGRGLPRAAGHRAGLEALKRTIRASKELGIKHLTVYAFSTENWQRPKPEVELLMSLFSEAIDREFGELKKNNIRIRFLGRLEDFAPELREKMKAIMEETKGSAEFGLNIMVSYGGRAEIAEAVNKIRGERGEIDEKTISDNLYTAGIPDPDLLIRTANERRVSNFMLWQIAYAELYFTKTLWPDFGRDELVKAVIDYQGRERRFGKV